MPAKHYRLIGFIAIFLQGRAAFGADPNKPQTTSGASLGNSIVLCYSPPHFEKSYAPY
jgi:hypothetical protein